MSTFYRPTWAEIDLDALAHNFRQARKIVGPSVKIMVTVKADAYGHGIIPISRALVLCGVDYLGVASIDEGVALRAAGITLPILVLGTTLPAHVEPIIKNNLTQTVCTEELAVALHKAAKKLKTKARIHIKIDTGMGRLGVGLAQAKDFIKKIHSLDGLTLEGIFTHFPMADTDPDFTRTQIADFNRLIDVLQKEGIEFALRHAANSMGTIGFSESHLNMVRPGLMIYGIHPHSACGVVLKPVLSLKTKVVFANRFQKGKGISYGHAYTTQRDSTIVNLPIGYGDGYPRNLSNRGPILINGKRFTISGRICMDQILVDVGNADIKIGDDVVLIGSQDSMDIKAQELADLSGTIPYEIVCGIGARVPRVYLGKLKDKVQGVAKEGKVRQPRR